MSDARPLALQLWTVREAFDADPAAALRRTEWTGDMFDGAALGGRWLVEHGWSTWDLEAE